MRGNSCSRTSWTVQGGRGVGRGCPEVWSGVGAGRVLGNCGTRQHALGVGVVSALSWPVVQGEMGGDSLPPVHICPPPSLLVPLTLEGDICPAPVELVFSVLALGPWEQHLQEPWSVGGQGGRRRRRQQLRESQGKGRTMAGEARSCLSHPTATRNWLPPGCGLASVPGPAPALLYCTCPPPNLAPDRVQELMFPGVGMLLPV